MMASLPRIFLIRTIVVVAAGCIISTLFVSTNISPHHSPRQKSAKFDADVRHGRRLSWLLQPDSYNDPKTVKLRRPIDYSQADGAALIKGDGNPAATSYSSSGLSPDLWIRGRTKHVRTSQPAAVAPVVTTNHRSAPSPLKIFILSGQSNMEGRGYMDAKDKHGNFLNGTLEWMVETFPETYGKLRNDDDRGDGGGRWTERDDVWITYNRQSQRDVRPEWNQRGKLKAGYGGDPRGRDHQIGPELGFGWAVGDAMTGGGKRNSNNNDDPDILIIKVAWGAKSLAKDFRPPSSGGTTGRFYKAMLANVRRTLSNLPELVPGYGPSRGYEISGFAWHQGWSDARLNQMSDEYEFNLANLIRDVRADLGAPGMPAVIGVTGMYGWGDAGPPRTPVAKAQVAGSDPAPVARAQFAVADAASYPEFEGTVATVETRGFYREPKPASPSDDGVHWNNNCESYWLIGQAMGEAMVDLIFPERRLAKHGTGARPPGLISPSSI